MKERACRESLFLARKFLGSDFYVTNYGSNTWWLNRKDGTFANHTEASGVEESWLWSSSAAFLDFDRDGWLDLFEANGF
ncbi:MAG: VCBS repeat-containing protein [Verrucomicrobia bacterium]|nr:VCBS repeat-containing protein [Verrucomicrobiota bacterium]